MKWKMVRIGDFCKVQAGGKLGLTKERDYQQEGYPAFSASGQDGFVNIWEFDQPGIVVSSIGARCGKSFFATGKWASLANTQLILPNPHMCEPKFLWYVCNDEKGWVKSGSAQPFIKPSDIINRMVPLPPISEQRRIVEILDRADGLRRKRREANALAERILPALFYKMFGDPARNEKGWKKKRLRDLVRVKSGEPVAVKDLHPTDGYPVYGGNGINGYHTQYMFDEPVVVIGRVGVYCGAVYYSQPKSWITDNALYVSEKSNELLDRYLVEALRIANLNQYAGRAGQPLISGSRIYPIEIFVPPINLQEEFGQRVEELQANSLKGSTTEEQMERLFRVLLHRAFTGELTKGWEEGEMLKR